MWIIMPIMPILMVIVYMMGVLSISFLSFRYFPGPAVCVTNVIGMLTLLWAIQRFFDKKAMFDFVQYALHAVYTVCIFMIWKNFAILTTKYLNGGDIRGNLNPAIFAEGSYDWMLHSVKWLAMVIVVAFILFWVIEWTRALVKWWKASPEPKNVNMPLWRGDHYAYTRDKEPSRLLEMYGGKIR